MANTKQTNVIRVLAFREGDAWVAQCIEHDVCAQGDTADAAKRRLEATLNAECEYTLKTHGTAFAGIAAAPEKFLEMFEEAEQGCIEDHMDVRIAA